MDRILEVNDILLSVCVNQPHMIIEVLIEWHFQIVMMEIPWEEVLKGLNLTTTTAMPVKIAVNMTSECPYGFMRAVTNKTLTEFSNGTRKVELAVAALCKPEPDNSGGTGHGNMTSGSDQVG